MLVQDHNKLTGCSLSDSVKPMCSGNAHVVNINTSKPVNDF